LGIPADNISVVHLAAGESFKPISDKMFLASIRAKYHLPEKFVLYVGDVNYNKNILTLCKACKLIKTPLVIVGKQAAVKDFDRTHPETQPFVKLLREFGEDKNVIRVGFVPHEELVAFYNLANVYVQPSYYEGFGLPLLEAFASGTPALASRIQAHVEIAGDACLYADPKNPSDFADKIKTLLSDGKLRKELVKKGLIRAKEYSWDKVANETVNIYRQIAE
jgi:glycosyltransferase involved in cell wall biosynthesis